jgi:hypothetical protein
MWWFVRGGGVKKGTWRSVSHGANFVVDVMYMLRIYTAKEMLIGY